MCMSRMLMSAHAVCLLLVLATLGAPPPAAAASVTATSWVELDGSGTRDGLSRSATGVRTAERDVSAAMDPDGNPVVAYVDEQTGNVIVTQLIDGVWTQLGTTPGAGVTPRVKVHTDGTINVAWRSATAVLLAQWSGTAWVGLAGSDTGGGATGVVNPESFALALDLAGNPIIVFDALPQGAAECLTDGSVGLAGEQVYAVQWTGSAWSYLGSDTTGPGATNALSFAIPGAGQSVCHSAIMPDVAVDSSGLPVVVFVYTTGSNDETGTFFVGTNTDIYSVRWDGGDWIALGPTVPDLPLGPGLGQAGGLSNNANASALPGSTVPPATPSIAVGIDNRPVVAWSDNSTDPDQTRIFVRKFSQDVTSFNVTTASWLLIGTASAAGTGISPLTGNNAAPHVAIGKLQQPRVAWLTVGTTGRPAVHVKRLGVGTGNTSTVTTWVEETPGSASLTGINGPSVDGGAPALAIDPDSTTLGPFVAWLARGVSVPQVFARQMAAGAGITATLTVTLAGGGTGTVTSEPLGISCPSTSGGCSQVFPTGTMVTLTATPDAGLTFNGWTGACTNSSGPCVVTLTAAKTVTARFEGSKLTVVRAGTGTGIAVSAPGGISCGLDCVQAFALNSEVIVTATAFAGSSFDKWDGCASISGVGNVECHVFMNAAKTITASFSTAVLTVAKTGTGTGTVTGTFPAGQTSAAINCGSVCISSNALGTGLVLTATPDPGSSFVSWTGCNAVVANSCSVTMSSTRTVSANFSTAKLTIVKVGTGSGTVIGTAPAGTSAAINCGAVCVSNNVAGTMLTLTALPGSDSAFTSWSGCNAVAGANCSVTLAAARTVTANFTSVTLTVARAGTGTVIGTDPGATINCGTTCTQKFPAGTMVHLQASNTDPHSGFTAWSGCTSTNGSTCTVLMSATRTVTAVFVSNPLMVAIAGVGGGTGTVTGVGNDIACGATCKTGLPPNTVATLTATPAQGALFTRWAGCTSTNGSTCTVLMNTARTVTAVFTSVTLTVGITGSGQVTSDVPGVNCSSSCTGRFVPNTTVVLTATPSSTSGFTAWTGCASTNGSTCTVLMNVARSVTATFTSRRLTVVKSSVNGGFGTVEGPAFTCGAVCFQDFPPNTQVTVTATPDGISGFRGWTGCASVSGPGNTSCTVTMSAAKTVTATFARFGLTVTKTGIGTVQDTTLAINCGTLCAAAFAAGTTVTLTATPGPGQALVGFTGCATVVGNNCSVVMTQARAVAVRFAAFTLTVTKLGAGTGTITSDVPGINCRPDCSESYPAGTTVTLTANPAVGSSFTAFTGCTPTGPTTCTVVMSAARSVTGTFTSP
jgi:hypothetical protein